MKRIFLPVIALSVVLISPGSHAGNAASDATMHAHQAPVVSIENSYIPGLGEIMAATQMRHAKLWFAGKAGNWRLAEYELFELKEGFDDAVKLHSDRTELLQQIMSNPTAQLKAAISKKDAIDFKNAYKALTDACNACHIETNFEFNRVIIPAANPYTNQDFESSQ